VYFVDKKNVVTAEVGQNSGQVPHAFDGRTGCCLDINAYLGGDNVGKAGLAEPGRPVKKYVVDRLAATLRRGNGNL
jgi:hypothetical protein